MARTAGVWCAVLFTGLAWTPAFAQSGSVVTFSTQIGSHAAADTILARSPRGAMRRAALVPGWGQIYNRHYVKLPFLYAGMGVLLVSAIQANSDYGQYRRAFLYKAFQDQVDAGTIAVNPQAGLEDDYNELAQTLGPVSARALESHRDTLRRNRDLSILGFAGIWALGVLDAYVSAHMSDFDVGEDLSIRVAPRLGPTGSFSQAGIQVTIQW